MPIDYSQNKFISVPLDLPELLYKYRRWDNQNDRRLLTHNEIFFSSPRRFNDPFDFGIPLRFDLADEDYLSELYEKIRNSGYMDIDRAESISGQNREQVVRQIKHSQFYLADHASAIENRFKEFGIFSMSAVPDNILMWSHYSDSHCGFCVGFDTQKLDEFRKRELGAFLKRKRLVKGQMYFVEVHYCCDYPCLIPSKENHLLIPLESFGAKAIDWSYEREYRLILHGSTDTVKRLDENAIVRVIMGCKMPDDSKNALIEILKARSQRVVLFQAKMKEGSFGLDFEQLDY